MKAKDLISIFEYGKAFGRDKEPKRRKYKKPKSPFSDFMEFQAQYDQFQKYMKEKADEEKKAMKAKEQKKEGMSPIHLAMLLMGAFPIIAPLYVFAMKMLLENMGVIK